MPEVKVLCDVFEDFLEVGYNLGVTVWDKGGYYNATSSKEVDAQLKTHELHCRAVASLIPLKKENIKIGLVTLITTLQ